MKDYSHEFPQSHYSTHDLIMDLRVELQKNSELLAKILPLRVKRYKDYWLSTLWGFSKKYFYLKPWQKASTFFPKTL